MGRGGDRYEEVGSVTHRWQRGRMGGGEGGWEGAWSEQEGAVTHRWQWKRVGSGVRRRGQMGVGVIGWEGVGSGVRRRGKMGVGVVIAKGGGVSHSQVATVSLDALGGAEALAVVGVAHAGVAVTLAG